jgi:sialic acid synthase SpsE
MSRIKIIAEIGINHDGMYDIAAAIVSIETYGDSSEPV